MIMMMMMKRQEMMNGVMVSSRCHRLQKSRKNSAANQKEAAVIAKQRIRNLTIIIITTTTTTRKTEQIHTKSTSIENGVAVGQVIVVWTQGSQFLLRMVRSQHTVPMHDNIQSILSFVHTRMFWLCAGSCTVSPS